MAALPPKSVVDTNVPKTANRALDPEAPAELLPCIGACITAIEHVRTTGGVVIDEGDAILSEYRRQLSLKGQPGLGDAFVKWVHDHQWQLAPFDRVAITCEGDSWREFPDHPGLAAFDPSDRKFVAVASAHPESPPILQATDSKWWEWRSALAEAGVAVRFLCPEFVRAKHAGKMRG
jgi:hypothetical protein